MRKPSRRGLRIRIGFILFIYVTLFFLISWRAFSLQTSESQKLKKLANRQYHGVVEILPKRGVIYDRNHEELAVSIKVDSVYVQPKLFKTRKETKRASRAISKVVGLRPEVVEKTLSGSYQFRWLRRQVSPDVAARIRGLDMKGVGLVQEYKRFYPNWDLAANLLGFVGYDSQGLEGLELNFNHRLRGQPVSYRFERDALGRDIMTQNPDVPVSSKPMDLVLTIDKNIQSLVESELQATVNQYNAKGGIVIMMDPNNGEILALAVWPSFNPNNYKKYSSGRRRNKAVTDLIEPGSTFKTITLAAALERAGIDLDQELYCEGGKYPIGKYTIHDHEPYDWLKPKEILRYSSNICMAKVGLAMGPAPIYYTLKQFGFGEKTGISVPGEASGILRDYKRWREIDLANISFGQGIGITPLQLITSYAAIANGGFLLEPQIVSEILDSEGNQVESFVPKIKRQVLQELTVKTLIEFLEDVVENGTGKKAALRSYTVAGKTGTAQKIDAETGKYSNDKMIASFIGFVPSRDPRFVLLALIDEPHPVIWGGEVAAPLWRRISLKTLAYLGVAPDRKPNIFVAKEGGAKLEDFATEGDNRTDLPGVEIDHDGERYIVPNLSGLSMRAVFKTLGTSGVRFKIKGSGRVKSQRPAPGTLADAGAVWEIEFRQ